MGITSFKSISRYFARFFYQRSIRGRSKRFEKIKGIANNEIQKATSLISNHIKTQEDSVVLFNTTNFEREELIELENGKKAIIKGIPPLGYKTVSLSEIEESNSENEKMKDSRDII